jgi:hypothetical protein
MPFLAKASHQNRYVQTDATAARLEDVKTLLDTVRGLPVALPLKKRMLVHGIWEVAKATGDFCGRYRSEAVIRNPGQKIQRDHIYQKRTLVEELLGPAPNIDSIIERAYCCIVTAEEHAKLHALSPKLDGWERYTAAGIVVYDMQTERPVAGSNTRLERIVSGGQTGADRAALDFAIEHNIAHGGWCPKGRLAEDGPLPNCYMLQETSTNAYPQRTEANVRESDGTVVITIATTLSGGSLETFFLAKKNKKPILHLAQEQPDGSSVGEKLRRFIADNGIKVLNVAGPRASQEPKVYGFVREVLLKVLDV